MLKLIWFSFVNSFPTVIVFHMYIVLHQSISKCSKNPSNSFSLCQYLKFQSNLSNFTLPVMICFQLWSQTFSPGKNFLITCQPKNILKYTIPVTSCPRHLTYPNGAHIWNIYSFSSSLTGVGARKCYRIYGKNGNFKNLFQVGQGEIKDPLTTCSTTTFEQLVSAATQQSWNGLLTDKRQLIYI